MYAGDDDHIETWGVTRTPLVEIRENHPSKGRVTIVAWVEGALTARTFEVSMTAFMRACTSFADRITAARKEKDASKPSAKPAKTPLPVE